MVTTSIRAVSRHISNRSSHPSFIIDGMGRPIRTDPADGWHHVMNRGAAGRAIFHGDVDRIELERLLGTVHERFGVQVHAWSMSSTTTWERGRGW
jgi:hypothetical protein